MSLTRLSIGFIATTILLAVASPLAAQGPRTIRVCVVSTNKLSEVQALYDPATGDTLVNGRPFSSVHPMHHGYAVAHKWYQDREAFLWAERIYSSAGLPMVIGVNELSLIGVKEGGVNVYGEAGSRLYGPDGKLNPPATIYIPVRPGCEFHRYTLAEGDALVDFAEAAIRKRDYAAAHKVLTRPSLAGHGRALARLGFLYHNGHVVGMDTAAASRLYERAIASNGAEGFTGRGVLAEARRDYGQAVASYRNGTGRGSTESAMRLASLHLRGQSPVVDLVEAARLLRMVITRSNPSEPQHREALMSLSRLYAAARGIDGDVTEWFATDSIAAFGGEDAFADFRMGRRYEMGWATWPDRAKAGEHYRNGALAGDTFSQQAAARLGITYK